MIISDKQKDSPEELEKKLIILKRDLLKIKSNLTLEMNSIYEEGYIIIKISHHSIDWFLFQMYLKIFTVNSNSIFLM
jgi:hypothetical protein